MNPEYAAFVAQFGIVASDAATRPQPEGFGDIAVGEMDGKGQFELLAQAGDYGLDTAPDIKHQQHHVLADQGEVRQSPLIGAGIRRSLAGEEDGLTSRIRATLGLDGYRVDRLKVDYPESGEAKVDLKSTRI